MKRDSIETVSDSDNLLSLEEVRQLNQLSKSLNSDKERKLKNNIIFQLEDRLAGLSNSYFEEATKEEKGLLEFYLKLKGEAQVRIDKKDTGDVDSFLEGQQYLKEELTLLAYNQNLTWDNILKSLERLKISAIAQKTYFSKIIENQQIPENNSEEMFVTLMGNRNIALDIQSQIIDLYGLEEIKDEKLFATCLFQLAHGIRISKSNSDNLNKIYELGKNIKFDDKKLFLNVLKNLSVDRELQTIFFESQNFEFSSVDNTLDLLDSIRGNTDLQNEYFSKTDIPDLTTEYDLCDFIEFVAGNPELIEKVLDKNNDVNIKSSRAISLLLYTSMKYPELKEIIDKLIKGKDMFDVGNVGVDRTMELMLDRIKDIKPNIESEELKIAIKTSFQSIDNRIEKDDNVDLIQLSSMIFSSLQKELNIAELKSNDINRALLEDILSILRIYIEDKKRDNLVNYIKKLLEKDGDYGFENYGGDVEIEPNTPGFEDDFEGYDDGGYTTFEGDNSMGQEIKYILINSIAYNPNITWEEFYQKHNKEFVKQFISLNERQLDLYSREDRELIYKELEALGDNLSDEDLYLFLESKDLFISDELAIQKDLIKKRFLEIKEDPETNKYKENQAKLTEIGNQIETVTENEEKLEEFHKAWGNYYEANYSGVFKEKEDKELGALQSNTLVIDEASVVEEVSSSQDDIIGFFQDIDYLPGDKIQVSLAGKNTGDIQYIEINKGSIEKNNRELIRIMLQQNGLDINILDGNFDDFNKRLGINLDSQIDSKDFQKIIEVMGMFIYEKIESRIEEFGEISKPVLEKVSSEIIKDPMKGVKIFFDILDSDMLFKLGLYTDFSQKELDISFLFGQGDYMLVGEFYRNKRKEI